MHAIEILLIACGLAMDAFAVAMGASASGRARGGRAAFRLSFHFGLFQFLMTLVGWGFASSLQPLVASIDHWIAFGLLVVVGGHMVYAALRQEERTSQKDPSRGLSLVALSVATSVDALVVGFSLGLLAAEILWPSLLTGIITAGLSLVGIGVGSHLGERFGRPVEILGGLLVAVIGVNIAFSHLIA